MTDPRTAHVAAAGDLLLGDSPISVGFGLHSRYPGRSLAGALEAVKPLFADRDIVLGNLESPLSRSGRGASRWKRDQMRGDPEYAAVLREAGFTALSIANNHALQHGRSGFDDTVAALESQGIAAVGRRGSDGWCSEPVVVTSRTGLRTGLLGYCWRPRQYLASEPPPYAEGSATEAAADVARLKQRCDSVVVSLHWGEDFVDRPSAAETGAARSLVAAGASLVAGHHPQVRRPVEIRGGAVIAYSLGNLVADLVWLDAFRDGAVLDAVLGPAGVLSSQLTTVRLGDDFAVRPSGTAQPATDVQGLEDSEYRQRAEAMLAIQRRRAYRYGLRHVADYPFAVLADLALSTIRNKVRRRLDPDGRGPR